MTKPFRVCVFIGRMQIVTPAHLANLKAAFENGDEVAVINGSAFQPRGERNLFKHYEVEEMLRANLTEDQNARLKFIPVIDYLYNDTPWVVDVSMKVAAAFPDVDDNEIALVGHKKDGTSYYLDRFPQWGSVAVQGHFEGMSATFFRNQLFLGVAPSSFSAHDNKVSETLTEPTIEFLSRFVKTEDFRKVCAEVDYYRNYRRVHEMASRLIEKELGYYSEIKFNTADALVTCSGHILLIQRKNFPGKDLWAMPGGFLDNAERLRDASIRELREETRLRVPEPVLRGVVKDEDTYDYPYRSQRGRVITLCRHYDLGNQPFPQVKARDDAKKAVWVKIADLDPEQMFEDHYQIIMDMLGLTEMGRKH